jgi:hypothetical protein
VIEFQCIDLDVECVHLEIRVDFCGKHSDIGVFAGSDWIRFEPRELVTEDAEQLEAVDS